MTTGIPLEKAQECLEQFNTLLLEQEVSDPFTKRRVRKELSVSQAPATNIVLSCLDTTTDKVKNTLHYLRVSLEVNNTSLAIHYHHTLLDTFSYNELREACIPLAKKYPTKIFGHSAYSRACRYDEREQPEFYMKEHIKLLSEPEDRSNTMRHKGELLVEMDNFYGTTQCLKERLQTLVLIIWALLGEYKAATGFIRLSDSRRYIANVKNLEPKAIAKMNFEFVDRTCTGPELDDYSPLARLSSPHLLHVGVSYYVGDQQPDS